MSNLLARFTIMSGYFSWYDFYCNCNGTWVIATGVTVDDCFESETTPDICVKYVRIGEGHWYLQFDNTSVCESVA